jgi:hypothetical protein
VTLRSVDVDPHRTYSCGVGALRKLDNRLLGNQAIGWISVLAGAFFGIGAIGAGVGVHPVLTVIYTVMSAWCAYWGVIRLRGRRVRRSG